MKALLSFEPLFRCHYRSFLLALVLSLFTLIAGIALLAISGWFLTAAFLTTAAMSFNLFGPSAAVRGLSFVRILSRYGEKLVGHDATLRVLADIRQSLFKRLDPARFLSAESMRQGDAVSRLTADVDALDSIFIVAAGPIATAVLVAALMTAIMAVVLPSAAVVYGIAMLVALVVVPALLACSTRHIGSEIVRLTGELRIATFEIIDGHTDILAFGAGDRARLQTSTLAHDLVIEKRKRARATALATFSISLLAGASALSSLIFGLQAFQTGALAAPPLVGLLLATLGSFEAIGAVIRQVGKFGSAIAAGGRIKALADMPSLVTDPMQSQMLPEAGSISFEHVTFGYGDDRRVLDNINLIIEEGSRIAIVGPSGSGKSTLATLLLRLTDPREGKIRIGGTDIRNVAQSDLHRKVALLEQNAPIFIGSIRDNLRIGQQDATDDKCWSVLEKAKLADFVRTLPLGLSTPLGEAGHTISAGQGRRLCLARMLISNAAIIVLDEPTSGLDRDTELSLLRDLRTATTGRTVLLITHSLLPEGVVDRTVYLRNGRLVKH
ncbi:thiol reductant ABC exporter subunit CydC [Agrobacterium rosae]|uniref:Thiol reductant ABC exporter subunit CydC n=1 Tax=Agrobacterium rosae TaxID=1972867 RepID=A0AAW9FS12_9HYPH|nr:thiol reductant ABC exporter subunit CydC [Agrobacterium rosae]MDX8305650.1 thiol reductant ABC exporter subunit CydC [Agrobacterium rosae]